MIFAGVRARVRDWTIRDGVSFGGAGSATKMAKELKTPLELVRLIRKHRRAYLLNKCFIVIEPDARAGWIAKSMATPDLVAKYQPELDAIAVELRENYGLKQ